MFKNPIDAKVQFSSPLIKKFLCKGYICEEIIEKEVTTVRLRHDKNTRLLEYKSRFGQATKDNN